MKSLLIVVFLFIFTNLYSDNISDTMYDTFFSAPIGEKTIEIVGTRNSDRRFDDNKILILKDHDGKILDSKNIYYPDTNYRGAVLLSCNAFALRITIKKPYQNCFIYTNSTMKNFCFYDCSKWVADGILLDNYILYSTEFDNNTIKRIDLSNNTIYSYIGYYPNVTLYECNKADVLGIFEFEGIWYEVYNDVIKKTSQNYTARKHSVYDFFFDAK